MSKARFSDDFKRDAVRQITDRAIRLQRCRSGWALVPILCTRMAEAVLVHRRQRR